MKRLGLLLALMLVLGIGMNAIAAEGPLNHSETITVQATVAPYAKIQWGDEYPAQYSGAADETQKGKYYFTLESNCKVGFALDTEALTQVIGEDVYKISKGIRWGVKKIDAGFYGWLGGTGSHRFWANTAIQDIGTNDYYLTFEAATGDISDQYAGTYTANVTITITSLDS